MLKIKTAHPVWQGRNDTDVRISDEEFEVWMYRQGLHGPTQMSVYAPGTPPIEMESLHELDTLIRVLGEARNRWLEMGIR